MSRPWPQCTSFARVGIDRSPGLACWVLDYHVTGPVSFALAISPLAGGFLVAVWVGPLLPLRVKSSVAPTEIAITKRTATPVSSHFRLLFLGGCGGGRPHSAAAEALDWRRGLEVLGCGAAVVPNIGWWVRHWCRL